MKNQSVSNKIIGFTVAAAMLSTVGAVGVFAKETERGNKAIMPKAAKQMMRFEERKGDNLFKDIKREVKNLSNGVEVTLTSEKAEVVTKLQNGPEKERELPVDSKVTINKENLTNGVKITITSTDAELVKKIQERETFGGKDNENKPKHGSMDFLKKVTRVVENTSTGVAIIMTSTDAEVVKKLQEAPAEPKEGQNNINKPKLTFAKENLVNGVKIAISSTDAEAVKKIQEHEGKMGKMVKKMIKGDHNKDNNEQTEQ